MATVTSDPGSAQPDTVFYDVDIDDVTEMSATRYSWNTWTTSSSNVVESSVTLVGNFTYSGVTPSGTVAQILMDADGDGTTDLTIAFDTFVSGILADLISGSQSRFMGAAFFQDDDITLGGSAASYSSYDFSLGGDAAESDDKILITGYGTYAADARNGSGGKIGGSDAITINSTNTFTNTTAIGDFRNSVSDGAFGGNDTIEDITAFSISSVFTGVGDVRYMSSTALTGGNDILTATNREARLYGDVEYMLEDGSVLTGGDDTITGGSQDDMLYGEFSRIDSSATGETYYVTGGDDHIMGGAGDDLIYGEGPTDDVNNSIILSGGHDTLEGGEGNDTIYGGSGDDMLYGNADDDILIGGDGQDTFYGGTGFDTIDFSGSIFALSIGLGESGAAGTAVSGGVSEILYDIEKVIGTTLNDTITGNSESNTLNGGAGNDILDGGGGTDFVSYEDATSAVTVDLSVSGTGQIVGGGYGVDELHNIEGVIGSEIGDDMLTGSAAADILIGLAGADTLDGGEGADVLEGGAGADMLDGGDDSDTADYSRSNSSVTVDLSTMTVSGGHATGDTLVSIENVTGSISNDTLTGDDGINELFGNEGADVLSGNGDNDSLYGEDGGDTLNGGEGDDILDGGLGTDAMAGGTGNDTYVVDNVGDTVIEMDSEGIDLVQTSAGYTLSDNVENGELLGVAAINLVGNGIANVLTGNGAGNILLGGGGDDNLNGRGGADDMRGGAGNDNYVIDNTGDMVIEVAGAAGGIDLIRTAVSYTLSANVENGIMLGNADIFLAGNELDNTLVGNDVSNTLNGRGGADRMFGYGGDDTYVVDNAGDFVGEVANNGIDTVLSAVSRGILEANVERLTMIGSGNINGSGNTLGNVILGNDGINVINGREGNDTILAGLGLDTQYGGTGSDTFVFNSAAESGPSSLERDRIADFTLGDLIYLAAIDADEITDGNQAFALDTDGSFSAGEIKQTQFGANLLLEMNTDADAAAEMSILLLNSGPLDAGDFVL